MGKQYRRACEADALPWRFDCTSLVYNNLDHVPRSLFAALLYTHRGGFPAWHEMGRLAKHCLVRSTPIAGHLNWNNPTSCVLCSLAGVAETLKYNAISAQDSTNCNAVHTSPLEYLSPGTSFNLTSRPLVAVRCTWIGIVSGAGILLPTLRASYLLAHLLRAGNNLVGARIHE